MQHRGELLKKAIEKSGIPKTRIVALTGRSRRWLYNQIERSDVPLDVLLELGKIIHHDFATEIPDLRSRSVSELSLAAETDSVPYPETAAYWKDKYLKLLEEYMLLLKNKS